MKINMININLRTALTSDEIVDDVEGKEEDLNEERLVGLSDEDDNDPSDTTPAEAEKLSDEGGDMFKEERKKRKNPNSLEE